MSSNKKTKRGDDFNSGNESMTLGSLYKREYERKFQKFEKILSMPIVDIQELKEISWHGIPRKFRPRAYRLFLDYEPINHEQAKNSLEHKRNDYLDCLNRVFDSKQKLFWTNGQKRILHQIQIDLPRTNYKLLHDDKVQEIFQHVLFIWAIRHPASSYVQGMNDILIPFFILFLSQYFEETELEDILKMENINELDDKCLKEIEADCFWCFSTMLDGIQDTFTKGQPGIFRMINQLQSIIKVVEPKLNDWIEKENINYMTFMFKWINCMFVREFSIQQLFRIWDIMINRYAKITLSQVYISAAMITTLSPLLINLPASEFIIKIQEISPEFWDEKRTNEIIAQSFVYEKLFPQLTC